MGQNHHGGQSITRRTTLKAIGIGVIGSTISSSRGTACGRSARNGERTWGDEATLGNGTIKTFVQTNQSGTPTSVGVHMTANAFDGLPPGDNDIHTHEKELLLGFPAGTPFQFAMINWNADGHPPKDIYDIPHFDFHFFLLNECVVKSIAAGPAQYSIPDDQMPTDYTRLPLVDTNDDNQPDTPLVEKGMGEHLIDPTAPEFNDGTFTQTFIWGAWDPEGDGIGELVFMEPMITRQYLLEQRGELATDIKMPAAFAKANTYPTSYVLRYLADEDAYTVTLESFESFPASTG